MHMPLRQQVRGDGFPTHNHRRRQQSEADGSPNQEAQAVKHKGYRKTHSQDSPSDRLGTRPSDNFHQKACCEQQVVNLLSQVLFAPRLLEYRSIVSIFMTEGMNLRTPVIIIVRLRLDERIERIYNLAIANNDNPHGTYRTPLIVCCFKIYSCKIFHFRSSLYLFHILFIFPAISLRSQKGSNTSTSSPFQSSSC